MGTMATRLDRHGDEKFFGSYPYKAVVIDVGMIGADPKTDPDPELLSVFKVASFVSVPFDLVIDTICLPIDLILWPFGFHKSQ